MSWWPFKKKAMDEGALVYDRRHVEELFMSTLTVPPTKIKMRDVHYLELTERGMMDFVWKYYHPKIEYHSNSEEFPDCDDFSIMARGSIVSGAVKEGFKYLPLFGGVSYFSTSLGNRHRANWASMQPGKLWIFEPQNMKWKEAEKEVLNLSGASI